MNRAGTSSQGWRVIGGRRIYFRSKWEANYARLLEWRKERGEIAEWEHEPHTFWFENIKRGVRSYLPDFRVTHLDGRQEYHEVKGWMDPKSETKLKRMAKYYPEVQVHVVAAPWFKANGPVLGFLPGWE